MTEPHRSRPGAEVRSGRVIHPNRATAIGRVVFMSLLTLFFLLCGLALVIQPALRWSGLVLVTVALITGSFSTFFALDLRAKRVRGGGRRATRWTFGTACVVLAWLAAASALALGSGDRSAYMFVMLIVGAGGFAYLALAWWRFERVQRAKRPAAE